MDFSKVKFFGGADRKPARITVSQLGRLNFNTSFKDQNKKLFEDNTHVYLGFLEQENVVLAVFTNEPQELKGKLCYKIAKEKSVGASSFFKQKGLEDFLDAILSFEIDKYEGSDALILTPKKGE